MKEKSYKEKWQDGITQDEIIEHEINIRDIEGLNDFYLELKELEKEYKEVICDRKNIAEKITKETHIWREVAYQLYDYLKRADKYYNSIAKNGEVYIKGQDCLEVIKKLANFEEEKYTFKTINYKTNDFTDHHGNHCTHPVFFESDVDILAEKEVLSKLPSSFDYKWQLSDELEKLYKKGSSMLIACPFGERCVDPSKLGIYDLEYRKPFGIDMFLQNDESGNELANAVSSLENFMEENGYDISNMNKDNLVKVIKSSYSEKCEKEKQRTIKKV